MSVYYRINVERSNIADELELWYINLLIIMFLILTFNSNEQTPDVWFSNDHLDNDNDILNITGVYVRTDHVNII